MLDWRTPLISDLDVIKTVAEVNHQFGNEMSAVNLFLYRNKYDTKIAFFDNLLFRQYNIDNQIYFGIPLPVEKDEKSSDEKILHGINILISEESANKTDDLDFTFVYEKDLELLNANFSGKVIEKENESVFDYIYSQENLGNLLGAKYQKKRNHISRFLRTFPKAEFHKISKENIEDAWMVEKLWFQAEKEKGEISKSAEQEFGIIREALDKFFELNLSGGVVYVDGKPVAMTVASLINSKTLDIHFEKGIMPYAFEGAYSFINNQFAKMQGVDFINREEDLGLPGLKKAKLSYYPSEILKKWDVKLLLN